MSTTADATERNRQSRWPWAVSLGLIASVVAAYFLIPAFQSFVDDAWRILTSEDERAIRQWVEQFGLWGPLLIVAVMTAQMFLIVVPTWALMAVTVLAYGFFWGVLVAILSVVVASSVGYAVGICLSDVTVERLVGPKAMRKVNAAVERYGLTSIVLIRLAPFLSNDAISFIAGMLKMKFGRFMAATLLGITPLALLIGWFGKNWERLKSGLVWFSAILLLVYGAYLVRDWRRQRHQADE